MMKLKYICFAVNTVVVVLLQNTSYSATPPIKFEVGQTSPVSKVQLVSQSPNNPNVEHRKIIGKGATLGKDADVELWASPGGQPPASRYLEFARENPKSDTADEALLVAAEKLAVDKEYERALNILDMIIKQYPDSASIDISALMSMLISVNAPYMPPQVIKARKAFVNYIDDHPNFTADQALVCKALLYRKLGKKTEAVTLLEEYIQRYPNGQWEAEDAKVRAQFNCYFPNRTDQVICWHLACFHYDDGNYVKSCAVLARAMKTYAASFNIVFFLDILAKNHMKTGNKAEEKKALMRLNILLQDGKYMGVGTDKSRLPLYHYLHMEERIRSLEQINQRLRELGVNVVERKDDENR